MSGASGPFKRLFPENHIPVILSAILQAGKSLCKVTEHDQEDWITRRLHARIIRLPLFRDGPTTINFQLQPEIPSMNLDSNTPAGKIDLLVPCNRGYQSYFAIEAKRLRFLSPGGRFNTGNREYVRNGMMRFIKGQYSPFMETGAMLGYVFDGNIETARFGVGEYILKKARELKLNPQGQLAKSELLPQESVDETRHHLKDRTFTIYHIFIDI
jgi:hypothetical protein